MDTNKTKSEYSRKAVDMGGCWMVKEIGPSGNVTGIVEIHGQKYFDSKQEAESAIKEYEA